MRSWNLLNKFEKIDFRLKGEITMHFLLLKFYR